MTPRIRPLRPFAAAAALVALAACSSSDGGGTGPEESQPAAVLVASRNPHPGLAGQRLPDSVAVRVVDGRGAGVEGAIVRFAVTAGGGEMVPAMAETDAQGYARALWVLGDAGPFAATATTDGVAPAQLQARMVAVDAAVVPMYGQLGEILGWAVGRLEESLPGNPQAATFIRARMALLRTPGIGGDIADGARWRTGGFVNRAGTTVPVTALFPAERMRDEAGASVALAEASVPVLEDFLGLTFPHPYLRLWHGFTIGNAGGGGALYMEDRATYDERTQGGFLPYDPILVHEIAHSWVGSEPLTQFLEVYGENVRRGRGTSVAQWTFVRGYVPERDTNQGVHALLDVYRRIGPAAMAQGYRDAIALRPPYGQPLTPAMQQAFVAAAPEADRAYVAAKMAMVGA